MRKRQVAATRHTITPRLVRYALEQLFVDQDRDLVGACVAPLIAWVAGKSPREFAIERCAVGVSETIALGVSWDLPALTRLIPGLRDHVRVLREGRGPQREHVAELAAYGLAFVAISALMPGRRVITFRKGSAPDLLFDVTPGKARGVEVAGRSTGGFAALKAVRDGTDGKKAQLRALAHIAEAHLSLWCADPEVALWEQVRP